MKKRFKLLNRGSKVYILHWANDGKLFGPDWEAVATFDDNDSNLERCKTIIRLLNECDKHTDPLTMTEQEIIKSEQGYSESKIQHICVVWFRMTFPHVANLLFAVPNGGWRGGRAGAQMVYEGQVKGVADLILLYPSGGKSSLCLEMKVPKKKGSSAGTQKTAQKEWQALVEKYGSTYEVCHGLIEFIKAVCAYLQIDSTKYIDEALNKYPLYR